MTPLGLTGTELARALGRYRLQLQTLARALDSAAPRTLYDEAFPALEDLGALIEVDLGARSAPTGQARMSELERALFVPLLARLRGELALLRRDAPSRGWLPSLRAVDEDIADTERVLAHH